MRTKRLHGACEGSLVKMKQWRPLCEEACAQGAEHEAVSYSKARSMLEKAQRSSGCEQQHSRDSNWDQKQTSDWKWRVGRVESRVGRGWWWNDSNSFCCSLVSHQLEVEHQTLKTQHDGGTASVNSYMTQRGLRNECLEPSASQLGPNTKQLELNLFSGKFTLSRRARVLPGNGKAGLQDERRSKAGEKSGI